MNKLLVAGCLIFVALAGLVNGGSVGWRTDGTGQYPAANPPVEWTQNSNVIWATAFSKWGNASVVLSNGKIFICAEPATLVCVDAESGKVLWERPNTYVDLADPKDADKVRGEMKQAEDLQKEIGKLDRELKAINKKLKDSKDDKELTAKQKELTDKIAALQEDLKKVAAYQMPGTESSNGFSSCTPTTDGQFVYAFFGNGVAVCYDFDGNRKWRRIVEKPTAGWGQSSSPVLAGGRLVILVNSLYALDGRNGDTLWQAKSSQRWGSLVYTKVGDVEVVVTPGGDIVRLSDGAVQAEKVSALGFCAPIVQDNVAYFIQAGGKAVKMTADGSGAVKAEVLWTTKPKDDRYYASPLFYDGLIYAINQKGEFSVIDANTGEVVHARKISMDGTVYTSITLAGKLIYLMSEGGSCVVLEPGREAKEIARNKFVKLRSTPVFSGNRMYIRARDKLYCIAKQ
jgi:outer membrane protein assembly factor BamB